MNGGPVSVGETVRPFPGLRPFDYDDHAFYFGRTEQVYSLYRMLDRSRFIAVVGSSGSGKSSLVFAGLRPLLEKDSAQPGGRQWVWCQMSPKNAPIDGLIDLVHRLSCEQQSGAESDPGFLAAQRGRIAYLIRLSSRGLIDALAEVEGLKDKTLVLVVDQFEELFRYAKSPQRRVKDSLQREEAVLFAQLLLAASRDPDSNTRIILTMRSDFIGDCASVRGLSEAVSETQFLVPALVRDQLEEVIRKPIEKCRATIESRLVERLLNDISDEADQLPVLQHCLLRLWQAAKKGAESADATETRERAAVNVTVTHYNDIGRIAGALSKHADEILSELAGLEPVVERVFRALCEVDKGGRATRRTLTFDKLKAETGAAEATLRNVLDRFRADDCSFLRPMRSAAPTLASDTPIDVGHEALLRHWERVCGDPEATGEANDSRRIGWLREEARDGRRYQVLLSMAGSGPADRERIPPRQVQRTWDWWTKPPRTAAWAERYGDEGGYQRVQQLLSDGLAAQRRLKWFKRGMAAVGCVLLAIGAGLVAMVVLERSRAERNFEVAANITGSLFDPVSDQLNNGDVSLSAASATVTAAEGAIEKLKQAQQRRAIDMVPMPHIPGFDQKRSEEDSLFKTVRTKLLLLVSDIYSYLGDINAAYEKAVEAENLAKQLTAVDGENAASQLLLYRASFRVADVLVDRRGDHNLAQGLDVYLSAHKIAEQLSKASPDDPARLYDLAFIENKIAETLDLQGKVEAMDHFKTALAIARRLYDMPSATVVQRAYLPSTLTKIGAYVARSGDLDAALADYSDAIARQEALLETAPNNDIVSANLVLSHRGKGDVLLRASGFAAAEVEYRRSIEIAKALVDKDSGNANWLIYLAGSYARYGNAFKASGDIGGAVVQFQNEVDVWQRLVNKDKTNPFWKRRLEVSLRNVAKLKETRDQPPSPAQATQDQADQSSGGETKP